MNTNDTTPVNPTPHLVAFEPCDGWWWVRLNRESRKYHRSAVAGWGVYLDAKEGHVVVAMTDDGNGLMPVPTDHDFSHLHKSGSTYCDCYDPTGDHDDYAWCPECGAEVFGRVK